MRIKKNFIITGINHFIEQAYLRIVFNVSVFLSETIPNCLGFESSMDGIDKKINNNYYQKNIRY
ncbi:hypothetical protein BpHYR1_007260 [Brachionus plicatilis]|uniref:Uncharacterized protein n=1 Tax=Brachionus plicatilis TaxID=10195 RepID=A0A3M7T7V6_BRAPC|nr:hypothetical protein BpHYR1_007260 [Brachionus plicatilis]